MANKKGAVKVEAANVKFLADTLETKGRANELSDKKEDQVGVDKVCSPISQPTLKLYFLKVGPEQNPFEDNRRNVSTIL